MIDDKQRQGWGSFDPSRRRIEKSKTEGEKAPVVPFPAPKPREKMPQGNHLKWSETGRTQRGPDKLRQPEARNFDAWRWRRKAYLEESGREPE